MVHVGERGRYRVLEVAADVQCTPTQLVPYLDIITSVNGQLLVRYCCRTSLWLALQLFLLLSIRLVPHHPLTFP